MLADKIPSAPARVASGLGLVILAFFASIALTSLLHSDLPPFLIFYPTVMLVAFLFGFWSGISATVLAALLADFFFFLPLNSFRIATLSQAFSLTVFCLMGVLMSSVAEGYRRNEKRLAALREQQVHWQADEQLRASRKEFETLANAIPQLAWIAEADGSIFWYNQRWYDYTGTTPDQMQGWGWQSVHDPRTLPLVLGQWNASIASGMPFDMTFPLRGHDGVFHPFLTRVMPVKNAAGNVVRWFGTNTDVTDQRHTEETLRASEAKLKGLINSAMDAVVSVDEQLRIVVFNRAAEAAFLCPAKDALGSSLDRFLPVNLRQSHNAHIRAFSEDGVTARSMRSPGILTAVRANGEAFPIEATISQVQTDTGKLYTVILRDITERQRSEDALRKSESRLNLAVEVASVGEWELDLKKNKGSRSLRHAQIFGYPSPGDDWTFSRFISHVLPQFRAEVQDKLNAIRTGESWEFETQIQRLDGDVRWVWVRGRSSLDADGKPDRAFGTVIDITERKRSEQALLRSEKLATVGQMAASISHEINNPLGAVVNLLYLAQNVDSLPEKARAYLQAADEEIKRITHITRQSLGFYRESNAQAVISINALLQSTLSLLQAKIRAKNATIEQRLPDDVKITAVGGEIRQVLTNLLGNSLDAIPNNGTISLKVSTPLAPNNGHRCVRITIADNGNGIPAQTRSHLFEPFFTTKGIVGTGLGLWVSKQIIDKHNGTIHVRSASSGPRRGTAFSVVLPASPEQVGIARSARNST